MSKIETFELDDNFDPLEDANIVDDEEVEDYDYLPPIPDADKSVVPEPVQLTTREAMDKLIAGIPGQKFRILHVINLCREPRTMEEIAEDLERDFPQKTSVYDAYRMIQLVEEAGGIVSLGDEDDEADEEVETATTVETEAELAQNAPAESTSSDEELEDLEEVEYLSVEKTEPKIYQASEEGLAIYDENVGAGVVLEMLQDDPKYLPIYQEILEMICADGGATTQALYDAINDKEILKNPRRHCSFFLNKLEEVSAANFDHVWQATELGHEALAQLN